MVEFLKEYASPLTVSGTIVFFMGLFILIFDYHETVNSDGYGFLILGGLALLTSILTSAGLIIRALFKKKKVLRYLIDSLLLLTAIILLILRTT